jgi:hypothetical protein
VTVAVIAVLGRSVVRALRTFIVHLWPH